MNKAADESGMKEETESWTVEAPHDVRSHRQSCNGSQKAPTLLARHLIPRVRTFLPREVVTIAPELTYNRIGI